MADHAVHGVDRLIGQQTGKTAQHIPEDRRHHRIGEILGAGFDGGAGDAILVQSFRIASDDLRHRFAAAAQAVAIQGPGDGGDMAEQTVLGDQCPDQHAFHRPAPQPAPAQFTDGQTEPDGSGEHADRDQGAAQTPVQPGPAVAVELVIEEGDQMADQGDRMGNDPPQPGRVAEDGV